MVDSTQQEPNVQRNSSQENTNWAAFGLDPITATVSNINPDAEAQPDADSRQDVEKTVSAWICVLGSFLTLIPTFGKGFMNSLGTVQTYLSMNQLHDYSEGEVGWISGLFLFLSLILNVQVGPMVDVHGPNVIGPVGAVLYVAMFLLMAECRNYWHFMLCLGVFGSIGAAMTMVVAIAIVGKLFVRKRGLAMGITLAGSSIGAVIFPIILRSTYPNLGWQWSMRIMAFISAGLLLPAILCFTAFNKIYKSSTNGQPTPKSSTLNFTAFQSPAFCFVTAGIFMFEFVIFSISGLLPSISTRVGFTAENGYTLLSIVGAASTFGRIIPGVIGDKYGHFNVLLATLVFTVIFMGALLVPFGTRSATALYAWSAIWGFGSGSFLSITPGMMNFVTAFALLIALPTSGAMLENMGPQALAGLFTGMTAVGGACYFAARALLIGRWLSPKTII
ncbi:Putative transporter MCH4 [Fusarium odoratissimum]|uniref:Putative transporter MCH4 n=1 Tax=Fusarium oxysporum f. sp. cubense (strain race 4) TaxID=2502994 RepID=N1RZV9_FUSC4|nr:Putative transporter MCH4 [Fusarium odoratissimum]